MRRTRVHVLLPALAAICVAWSTARAGSVPLSALSQSVGIDRRLLDDVHVVMEFPQLAMADSGAGLAPFSGLATRTGIVSTALEGSVTNTAALLRRPSWALFAATQPSPQPPSNIFAQFTSFTVTDLIQAGLAARFGAVSLGAAVRGARERRESTSNRIFGNTNLERAREQREYLEIALGASAAIGSTQVDVVAGHPRQSNHISGLVLTTQDTTLVALHTDPNGGWNVASRVLFSVGPARAGFAGGYERASLHWSGQVLTEGPVQADHTDQIDEAWSASASVAVPPPYLDAVALSAGFSRSIVPRRSLQSNRFLGRRRDDVENAFASVTAERSLWGTLRLYAFVSQTYLRTTTHVQPESGDFSNESLDRQESFGGSFGWGAAYHWRWLHVVGNIRPKPSVSDPLAALDVQIAL